MSMSIRTIFLFIRGVDQSGRALKAVQSNVEKLKDKQEALAQASYRLLFAGAAFTAFGVMVAKALGDIVSTTDRGSGLMEDFNNIITRFKESLGDAILDKFGDQIEGWLTSLEELTEDQWKMDLLATIAFEGAKGLITAGLVMITGSGLVSLLLAAANLATIGNMAALASTLTALAGAAATGTIVIAAAVLLKLGFDVLWESLDEDTQSQIKKYTDPVNNMIDIFNNPMKYGAEAGLRMREQLFTSMGNSVSWSGNNNPSGAGVRGDVGSPDTINVTNVFEQVNTSMDDEELLEGQWVAEIFRNNR